MFADNLIYSIFYKKVNANFNRFISSLQPPAISVTSQLKNKDKNSKFIHKKLYFQNFLYTIKQRRIENVF
jgi:hypothetical protein